MNSAEWTARSDIKHRAWRAREAILRYKQIEFAILDSLRNRAANEDVYTVDRQRLWSEQDGLLETILDQAVQLYKALESTGLPQTLRDSVHKSIDQELQLRVRVLRNIRTHWEDNRSFWTEDGPIPPDRKYWSARWYRKHFPQQTPWSASWGAEGHVIGGIVNLEALENDINRIEERLPPTDV